MVHNSNGLFTGGSTGLGLSRDQPSEPSFPGQPALGSSGEPAQAPAVSRETPSGAQEKPQKQRLPGIPSFQDNPLGAIGVILSQAAAGMRGVAGPVDRAEANAIEQQGLKLRAASVQFRGIEALTEQLSNTPPDSHAAVIARFEDILPGIREFADDTSKQQIERMKAGLEFLKDNTQLQPWISEVTQRENLTLTEVNDLVETTQETLAKIADEKRKAKLDVSTAVEKQMALSKGKVAEDLKIAAGKANIDAKKQKQIQDLLADGEHDAAVKLAESLAVINVQEAQDMFDALSPLRIEEDVEREKQTREGAVARAGEITGETEKARLAEQPRFSAPFFEEGVLVQKNLATNERKKLDEKSDEFSEAYINNAGNRVQLNLTTKREVPAEPVGRTPEDVAANEAAKFGAADARPLDAFSRDIGDFEASTTVGQAREQGFQIPNDEERKRIQVLESGGNQAISLIGSIRKRVQASPEAITAGGAFASTVNQLRAQAQSLADVLGFEVDFAAELGEHAATFKKFGIERDVLKSLVLDLSYVQAISRGQSGRGLSDKDVERFSRMIGTGRADPDVLTAILESLEGRFDTAFRTTVRSITRKRPRSLLPHVREAEVFARRIRSGEDIPDEDYRALSSRAREHLIGR